MSANLSINLTGLLIPTQRVSPRLSVTRTHLPPVQYSRAACHAASYTRLDQNLSASANGSFCACPPACIANTARPLNSLGSVPDIAALGPLSCISAVAC